MKKVDLETNEVLFPNLIPMNFYSGGALSSSKTMSEDLPTDAIRMQEKLNALNLLDPRTAEVVVLSIYPTFAARCLDTFVTVDGTEFPLKTSKAKLKALGITEADIKALATAIDTSVVPPSVEPS